MKASLMKRAHQIAKGLEGDYRARMSIALRQAWKEVKGMAKTYSWKTAKGAEVEITVEGKKIIQTVINGKEYEGRWGLTPNGGIAVEVLVHGKRMQAGIPSGIYAQIKKQADEAPKPANEQELRKRLQEIAAEAKAAKSDAVLSALAAERREILRQIGKKNAGGAANSTSLKT